MVPGDFRRLRVWNRAMGLVEDVYRLTQRLPAGERFGLVAQMRRAAVSVPSNLAEGYGRGHRADYARHVAIANDSLNELQTQLLIAVRVGYLEAKADDGAMAMVAEIGKMLNALLRALGSYDGHG